MGKNPRVFGIICEFNPFHYGHAALFDAARAKGASHLVCVMSGNYVQRGEPAILSKWARAETAVCCGADLVIELPTFWALAGAERFAAGGIALLHALGCVDTLCFGSECGDAELLLTLAQNLSSPSFSEALRDELRDGITFAAARATAAGRCFGPQAKELLSQPNNILAVEYCKAILRQKAPFFLFTLRRQGAPHDAAQKKLAGRAGWSSSALRERLYLHQKEPHSIAMPPPAKEILMREWNLARAPVMLSRLELAVLAGLRQMPPAAFAKLPDLSEGLENRLYKAVQSSCSLPALYEAVKAKRYPLSRIRRLVLSAFLGLEAPLPQEPPYLRVLAMSPQGQSLLRSAKKTGALPLVTRHADFASLSEEAKKVYQTECRATDLYALMMPAPAPCGMEQRASVIK